MQIDGYYYLTKEGDLIPTKDKPELSSNGPVKCFWPVVTDNRLSAWLIVSEGLALGAKRERIEALREKWSLSDEDAKVFAEKQSVTIREEGGQFIAVDKIDENRPRGTGASPFDAIANYIKQRIEASDLKIDRELQAVQHKINQVKKAGRRRKKFRL